MMMTTSENPPISFWIIAIIATLWNAMGIKQYLQHAYQTDAFKAMYTDENILNMVLNTPKWVMAAFAIAVLFGFLGSLLLLLRKQWLPHYT